MRRATGRRDDDLEPAVLRGGGVLEHPIRRAVRGNDSYFVWNFERRQQLRCDTHVLEVRLAAHDDADNRSRAMLVRHGVRTRASQAA